MYTANIIMAMHISIVLLMQGLNTAGFAGEVTEVSAPFL